jgi:hypothetical protein
MLRNDRPSVTPRDGGIHRKAAVQAIDSCEVDIVQVVVHRMPKIASCPSLL